MGIKTGEKFFNPDTLQKNLVAASAFIAAYEMFKTILINNLRGFHSSDKGGLMDNKGNWVRSSRYEQVLDKLRSKNLKNRESEMELCARWFKESGALNEEDATAIREITDHRNEIAHELPLFILGDKDVSLLHLRRIYTLTSKIQRWWVLNVLIPQNEDFDNLPPMTEEQLKQILGPGEAFIDIL